MNPPPRSSAPRLRRCVHCWLENYAYTWSPNAAAWRTKFEKSPKGFGENELSDEDAKTLEDAETARQLLVTAVDELRSKVRGGSAEQISRELYFCLKKLGAEEQQAALVEAVRTARRQRKRPASGTW